MITPRIEIRHSSDLTPAEESAIEILTQLSFHADPFAGLYQWAEVDWHTLVWVENELVSTLEIIERTGLVGNRPVRLGGIGGVCTHPDWRKYGLASRALKAAAEFFCQKLQVEFGILMTNVNLIPFYQHAGWLLIDGKLSFDQPGGKITIDDVMLVYPCGDQDWPGGDVDLCGLPF